VCPHKDRPCSDPSPALSAAEISSSKLDSVARAVILSWTEYVVEGWISRAADLGITRSPCSSGLARPPDSQFSYINLAYEGITL